MADRYQDRPFPADGGFDRGGRQASSKSESDPLAELARLIGQTDPFAGMGRANQPVQPRGNPRDQLSQPQQPQPQPAPQRDDPPAGPPPWMQRAATQPPPQDFAPSRPPAQRFAAPEPDQQAPAFAAAQAPSPQDFAPARSPQEFAPARPPQEFAPARPPQEFAPARPPQDFAPGRPAAPRYAEPDFQAQAFAPAQEEEVDPEQRYDEALYGQLPGASRGLPQDGGYEDPYAYQDDYGDETADQLVKPRRGGMTTIAVVVGLAVVGTGGAFAYRTFVGSPRSGEPPIIRADVGPNKMIPPMQSGDAPGKLIQDRMTGGGGTERMVSREETPVDLRDSTSGPRVVFPPLNQNANPPPAASVAPSSRLPANPNNASTGSFGGDEPRKIRTLSVRSDQAADAAAAPAAAKPAAAPMTRAMTAAARNPAPAANANASANSPMSLSPQAAAPAATRVAAINSPQPVTSTATSSDGGGGYMVQVASQRSEADAQVTYKSLQGKYSAVLGEREPMIKRVDLGEKGIYFRAMVGPFGSTNEATQFCNGLKTAGGQCIVQRN
jgi:SPOR domain